MNIKPFKSAKISYSTYAQKEQAGRIPLFDKYYKRYSIYNQEILV